MTDTEAAWLAGIIDGEGSFVIFRTQLPKTLMWQCQLTLTSTDDRIIFRCKELAQGNFSAPHQPKGNARTARVWTVKGLQLDRLIAAVRPYLVAKAEQCAIIQVLRSETKAGAKQGFMGVQRFTPEERERKESLRLAIRALNHRGVAPTPQEQLTALEWFRTMVLARPVR